MPEVTVTKDNKPLAQKHDIGMARKRWKVDAIAQP